MTTQINWITPREWADALRNPDEGTFQRRGAIADEAGGRCCLGVLCEKSGGILQVLEGDDGDKDTRFGRFFMDNWSIGGWIDVHLLPSWLSEAEQMTALKMNDSGKKSFSEIADWIDKEWNIERAE